MRCPAPRPARADPAPRGAPAFKLLDFGLALGVEPGLAEPDLQSFAGSLDGPPGAALLAGTLPYMSPEALLDPRAASYPADLWSLGVTLFEAVTGRLPFHADSPLAWPAAVGGPAARAPPVLARLPPARRARFDARLAEAIDAALARRPEDRHPSAAAMHAALFRCLVGRGLGRYSAFLSYRVASDAPLARLLFDALNNSVTPAGHAVRVYLDSERLVRGEDWEEGFAQGLLSSLVFVPLLTHGATAPLAALPADPAARAAALAHGWQERPARRPRLRGAADDPEDNLLKEYLIALALLSPEAAAAPAPAGAAGPAAGGDRAAGEGEAAPTREAPVLRAIYPVLVGRPQPPGHPEYPWTGDYFDVQVHVCLLTRTRSRPRGAGGSREGEGVYGKGYGKGGRDRDRDRDAPDLSPAGLKSRRAGRTTRWALTRTCVTYLDQAGQQNGGNRPLLPGRRLIVWVGGRSTGGVTNI
jgi:hypothetical protein